MISNRTIRKIKELQWEKNTTNNNMQAHIEKFLKSNNIEYKKDIDFIRNRKTLSFREDLTEYRVIITYENEITMQHKYTTWIEKHDYNDIWPLPINSIAFNKVKVDLGW